MVAVPESHGASPARASDITVISASYYESALIRGLIENLVAAADSSLSFLLCDNTNGADADLAALRSNTVTVVPLDHGNATMSPRHGAALTEGFARVTSKYCLIVDPDCRVLSRGWDQRCRAALDDGCVAVGAPFPPWKLGKYHDFPGPHFCFVHTAAIREAGGDWRPHADAAAVNMRDFLLRQILLLARTADAWTLRRSSRHAKLAAQCERWLGVVSKDTGWRVAHNVRNKRWRAELFATMRSRSDVGALVTSVHDRSVLGWLAEEFELYVWNGTPFVTHCSRTARFFDVFLWTGRPLMQIPRFWDRRARASVDDWETVCATVIGAA